MVWTDVVAESVIDAIGIGLTAPGPNLNLNITGRCRITEEAWVAGVRCKTIFPEINTRTSSRHASHVVNTVKVKLTLLSREPLCLARSRLRSAVYASRLW
jgi:hypothetical protein